MKRILVPTDGSALSERAQPLAEKIAAAQGACVILTRVVEPPVHVLIGAPGTLDPNLYQRMSDEADSRAVSSLDDVASRFRARSTCARTLLLHGSPAAALLDAEKEQQPDLVIMATHGRTGLARFALGSVADTVVREGTAPVLLVRAFGSQTDRLSRALVPLDGSAVAEAVLPMVIDLAGKPLESVDLLTVVSSDEDRDAAGRYLEGVQARLQHFDLSITLRVLEGEPAQAIARHSADSDLVMAATHGRGGFDRLRHGSVATQLVSTLTVPILLTRAGAPKALEGIE